jgi:hypothetical protein
MGVERGHLKGSIPNASMAGSTSKAKNTFFQSPYSQVCSLENKYYTEENAHILVV